MIKEQQKTEVSIQILEQLSNSNINNPISLIDVSHKLNLSLYYAENIFRQLRKKRLVKSARLNGNWYHQTTKNLSEITIQEINEIFDSENNKKDSLISPIVKLLELQKNKLLSETTVYDVLKTKV